MAQAALPSAVAAFHKRKPLALTADLLAEIENGTINPLSDAPYPPGFHSMLPTRRDL